MNWQRPQDLSGETRQQTVWLFVPWVALVLAVGLFACRPQKPKPGAVITKALAAKSQEVKAATNKTDVARMEVLLQAAVSPGAPPPRWLIWDADTNAHCFSVNYSDDTSLPTISARVYTNRIEYGGWLYAAVTAINTNSGRHAATSYFYQLEVARTGNVTRLRFVPLYAGTRVQASADLKTWTTIKTVGPALSTWGGVNATNVLDVTTAPKRFYRLQPL